MGNEIHSSNTSISDLLKWAYMGDFKKVINDLKNMALEERWDYKKPHPDYPSQILAKYLKFTFFRLSKEPGKIKSTDKYAAFNTGLVNKLYEPIYALFEKNYIQEKQEWHFSAFCIAGVGAGKTLVSNFNPLPERAHYFENLSDLIYDYRLKPYLDTDHIILDNVDRLPINFLRSHQPEGFQYKDTSIMDENEQEKYYKDLALAIKEDSKTFRLIKDRFSRSIDLALKRVEWNFKTAIPMYYPLRNNMSLLLPLSLIDDDIIDLALVTEKQPSGQYVGHTILPLDFAYNNARLITRPDSDWLKADIIEMDTAINNEDSE